ncbi:MAG: hypothetical protein ABSB74_03330 [Tepidisphaeraceae bacterium]
MEHQDDELSDVVVIIVDEPGMTTQAAAQKLKSLGLSVSDVDEENGAVTGTIETTKLKSLQKLEFVKYVRTVFNYIADYPAGDPRNLDPEGDELGPEADDAGA